MEGLSSGGSTKMEKACLYMREEAPDGHFAFRLLAPATIHATRYVP